MKLTKEQIIKSAEISALDADIRKEEWLKYYDLEPKEKNYNIEAVKKIFPDANYFDIDCIEGLYGVIDDYLFIMFRGSDAIKDWIRNAMFCLRVVPYDNMNKKIKVHQGFIKNYKKVRSFILDKVKESKMKKVIVYGHSMGAALTGLCSLDLQYNFPEKEIGAFAIGMPRIGNKYFKKSFEGRMPDFIRCTHRNDLVPQLPPELFGYVHVDKFYQLGGKRTKLIGKMDDHDWHLYLDAMKKEIEEVLKLYE